MLSLTRHALGGCFEADRRCDVSRVLEFGPPGGPSALGSLPWSAIGFAHYGMGGRSNIRPKTGARDPQNRGLSLGLVRAGSELHKIARRSLAGSARDLRNQLPAPSLGTKAGTRAPMLRQSFEKRRFWWGALSAVRKRYLKRRPPRHILLESLDLIRFVSTGRGRSRNSKCDACVLPSAVEVMPIRARDR